MLQIKMYVTKACLLAWPYLKASTWTRDKKKYFLKHIQGMGLQSMPNASGTTSRALPLVARLVSNTESCEHLMFTY